MTLLKNGKIEKDSYVDCSGKEDVATAGQIIISYKQWVAYRDLLSKKNDRLGIKLLSHEKPDLIATDLEYFSLIALEFPSFADGRAYSYARLLRDHYGYSGELRAVGDVLLEQLHFMQRVGFDAFEVENDDALEAWKTALSDLSVWYQTTGDGRSSVMQLRHKID
ncbi:MAG: DUF934 domain-containing protein [Pseudomonadota bacterium]|nr:DUF934 domain-containing protein [Pseudomonadota bacterium]